jgi:hypothetical protein
MRIWQLHVVDAAIPGESRKPQHHTRSTFRQELLRDNRVYRVEPPKIGLIKAMVRIQMNAFAP